MTVSMISDIILKRELTPAERQQRVDAAKARWNKVGMAVGGAVLTAAALVAGGAVLRRKALKTLAERGQRMKENASTTVTTTDKPSFKTNLHDKKADMDFKNARQRVKIVSMRERHKQQDTSVVATEAKAWVDRRAEIERGAVDAAKVREASANVKPTGKVKRDVAPRGRVADTYGTPTKIEPSEALRRLLSRKIQKDADGYVTEAEHQQRVDAANSRWAKARAAGELNAKGKPRQRRKSERPRDESGRVRPYTAEELDEQLANYKAKISARNRPSKLTNSGQLQTGSGQFAGFTFTRELATTVGEAIGGEPAGRFAGKLAEVAHASAGLDDAKERGILLGGGVGAAVGAAVSSKKTKQLIGHKIARVFGRAGATARVLGHKETARHLKFTSIKHGIPVRIARFVTNRRLIMPALIGAGLAAGGAIGSVFQKDKDD
jgi:hypothetical protein